ncbi:8646_t:CDS:2, partial [Racocetra fulgida]
GTVYGGITNNGTNNYIASDKHEEEPSHAHSAKLRHPGQIQELSM